MASSMPPRIESSFWKTCMVHVRVVALGLQQLLGE